MRRAKGKHSEDELDREIQGHVTTARRALGRAVDTCMRVRRGGQPRHLNRTAYKQLMGLLTATEQVRSAVPPPLTDPDAYPYELRERVGEIESYVRQANRALREATDMLRRAEEAFNEAGMTFASRELEAAESTEDEVKRLIAGLESYRGLRPSKAEIAEEPIRRERQQRDLRVRRTVQVSPRTDPGPVE